MCQVPGVKCTALSFVNAGGSINKPSPGELPCAHENVHTMMSPMVQLWTICKLDAIASISQITIKVCRCTNTFARHCPTHYITTLRGSINMTQ